MGGFNIDLLKNNTVSEDDMNTLGSYFYLPQILQPTRITDHTATLIDNIFFNSVEYFVCSGNLIYDLTDHLPNFIIFNDYSSFSTNIKMFKRDYSQFNKTEFLSEMQNINWQDVLTIDTGTDITILFDRYYSKISQIVDKHLPLRQLSKREMKFNSKPWITSALKVSISKRINFIKSI